MLRHYWSTLKHKGWVALYIAGFCAKLLRRALVHDLSKFGPTEAPVFAETLPKLEDTTYGSEEYDALLDDLEEALDHHYKKNRHHPEHFVAGINGMTLVDLVEMFCDWRAATRRHKDGDLWESVDTNGGRYGFSHRPLDNILRNTTGEIMWGHATYRPWNEQVLNPDED